MVLARLNLQSINLLDVEVRDEHLKLVRAVHQIDNEVVALERFKQAAMALDKFILNGEAILQNAKMGEPDPLWRQHIHQFHEDAKRALEFMDGLIRIIESDNSQLYKGVKGLIRRAREVEERLKDLEGQKAP